MTNSTFIPAAHYHALTPYYENIVQLFSGRIWKSIALEAARRCPEGGVIVDLGCGPGSVLRKLRYLRKDLTLVGTDIDPTMIDIARSKALGKDITFSVTSIEKEPFADHSVDVVISSLMFHHLPQDIKRSTLKEVKRILKRGGTFLLCDFSKPSVRSRFLTVAFWKYVEPEIIPQLHGQLLDLAEEEGAQIQTPWTMYGCISLHILSFPTNS